MDSDSDSEEEVNDLMREAANCDYVNNLYNNSYNNKAEKTKKNKVIEAEDQQQRELTSHQIFLSKSLSKKLDELINIVEVDELPKKSENKKLCLGIQLLKDSTLIDEPEIEAVRRTKRVSSKSDFSEHDRLKYVEEAAVSPEWVCCKSNTALWRFYKPKVIYAKAEKISADKLVCSITSKTF